MPPLRNRTVFLLVLGFSLAAGMLPVLWPQLDIAVAAYFLQAQPPLAVARSTWVTWVNEYTPDLFRSLALLMLGAWVVLSLLRPVLLLCLLPCALLLHLLWLHPISSCCCMRDWLTI